MGDLNWVDFFEEQSIKCGMERVFAFNCWTQSWWISRQARREEKAKYPDRIPVSGKTPELRKSPKNKVSQKVSQNFPKIINII